MTCVILTESDSDYEGDILLEIPLCPARNSSASSALWNVEFTPSLQCVCFLSLLETSRSSRTSAHFFFLHTRSGQNTFTIRPLATSLHFTRIFYFAFRQLAGCLFPSAALCLYRRPSCCCCCSCCKYARRFLARRLGHVLLWGVGGRGGISSAMLTMCQRRGGRRLFPIFGKSLSIAPPWRDGPPQRTRKYDGNPEGDVRI